MCPVLVVPAPPGAAAPRLPEVGRIVVPLDGSDRAEGALPPAIQAAAGFGAVLDLVHVAPWAWMLYAIAWQDLLPAALDEALEERASAYLSAVRARLPHTLAAERHVLRGDPADAILEHVRASGADLLVMTTHGRSGISRWALGSVADRLVRTAEAPVLLLRADLPVARRAPVPPRRARDEVD
jgi:nucleotide-binding universal stress UspA family protein